MTRGPYSQTGTETRRLAERDTYFTATAMTTDPRVCTWASPATSSAWRRSSCPVPPLPQPCGGRVEVHCHGFGQGQRARVQGAEVSRGCPSAAQTETEPVGKQKNKTKNSQRNPLWTYSRVTWKHFFSPNCTPAMFSVLCCCLHPFQLSVCSLF